MNQNDPLAAYAADPAFFDGVSITLDDLPGVECIVALPGKDNRGYMNDAYAGFVDSEGKVVGDPVRIGTQREDAFLKHCLLRINGKPPAPDLLRTHPRIVRELLAKGLQMANELEEVVEDAEKKSVPISLGSIGGATS